VPVGTFPKLPEERSSLLFRAKWGRGTLILNCLGKGKERLRVGKKESSQAQCMRDYWSSLLSRLSCLRAVLEHWKTRGDLHSRATETMKEA
jgi:hypothetical protein